MTQKQFIKTFNEGNLQQKAKCIIENDLREPSQHLMIPMAEGHPYASFHILGYTQVRAGIWYATTSDWKTIPIAAFALHTSGEKTFKEWAKTIEGEVFAEAFKSNFIEAFDNLVMPIYAGN